MMLMVSPLSEGLRRVGDLFKRAYNPADSLRDQIAHSTFWGFNIRLSNQVLMLVRTVVLARLLNPVAFGLYGIALILMRIVLMGTYPGVEEELIQEKNLQEASLDTAWTIRIIRGCFIAVVLFVGAPFAADFFAEPTVSPMIQVLGFSILLSMTRNPAEVYFRKDLRFRTQYIYELTGRFGSFLVSVVLAVYLRNAWALIWGFLAEKILVVLMSYWLHPYRPWLNFDFDEILRMMDYGRWITGNSLFNYVNHKGDDFLVGKILGSQPLGFYRIAFRASQMVPMGVTKGAIKVLFPIYSKIQDEPEKLREGFYKTFSVISAILFPAGVGIFLLVGDFTRLFLGTQWLRIVVPVQIMILSGVARALSQLWVPLYYSLGEPRLTFYKQMVRMVGIFLPMYPLIVLYGLEGVCLAVLTGMIASLLMDLVVTSGGWFFRLRFGALLARLFPTLMASAAMGVGLWVTIPLLPEGFAGFFLMIGLGVGIYLAVLWVYQRLVGYSPYSDLAFFVERSGEAV